MHRTYGMHLLSIHAIDLSLPFDRRYRCRTYRCGLSSLHFHQESIEIIAPHGSTSARAVSMGIALEDVRLHVRRNASSVSPLQYERCTGKSSLPKPFSTRSKTTSLTLLVLVKGELRSI